LSTKSTIEYTQYNSLFNATATLKPNEPLSGIFQTNALPCGANETNLEAQPAYEHGIFVVGSRFNSSCTPNVNAYWNLDSNEMEFRVMRNIEIGEELCIAYCDILKSRDERRKILKQVWNFDCHCDGCECKPYTTVGSPGEQTNEEEAIKMSNIRRESVGGLLETVAFGYTVDAVSVYDVHLYSSFHNPAYRPN
jgi:SET domain